MFNWSDVTVIFGGTFDPPHLSHLKVVRELIRNLGVARVLVIPSANPPHKPTQATSRHRLKMCELQFFGVEKVEINDLEIKREKAGKSSFSFDTVSELKAKYPKLAFAIGTDQLEAIPTWHRYQELLGLCEWVAIGRKPDGVMRNQEALQRLVALGLARPTPSSDVWELNRGHQIKNFETQAPEMSSTLIRRLIALQGTVTKTKPANLEGFLHPDVSRYLKDHKLYGT